MRETLMSSNSRHQTSAQDREDIEALGPWFHNIHLPDGRQTAPGHGYGDFPAFKWNKVQHSIPQDLRGWTVLDVGCNAGFYALELAKRGARVTALDLEPLYLEQARWVVQQCGLQDRIEVVEGDAYGLINSDDAYDLVWFTGVFYHLKYPVLALDLVRRATRRLMMFQTMSMPGVEVVTAPTDLPLEERDALRAEGWPKMAFVEHEIANDPTNWWAPNHACIEALLRAAGFAVKDKPEHEFYLCEAVTSPRATDLERLLGAARLSPRGLKPIGW
jgi:tRNA (mo5U34)-methyltransferase